MSSNKDNTGCLIFSIIVILIIVLIGKQEEVKPNNDITKDELSWLYADSIATIGVYTSYVYNNPNGRYVTIAREKIKELEIIKEQEEFEMYWYNEKKAWDRAVSVYDYEKYLSYYPKGEHAIEAEKRIVDGKIKRIMSGQYSPLPDMEGHSRRSSIETSTSLILITNSTNFILSVYYSGVDSKRVILAPNQSSTITLKNGSYRIAASVDAPSVSNFAGTKYLSGDEYKSNYYIETIRY